MIVKPLPDDLQLALYPPDAPAEYVEQRIAAGVPACCLLQALAYARGRSFCNLSILELQNGRRLRSISQLGILLVRLNDYGALSLQLSEDLWAAASKRLLALVPILDRIVDGRQRAQRYRDDCANQLNWAIGDIEELLSDLARCSIDRDNAGAPLFSMTEDGVKAREEYFHVWSAIVSATGEICHQMANNLELAYPPPPQ